LRIERSVVPGGWRDGDAELVGQGVVKEFVVGRPPEGVVDDHCSVQHCVLEESAVEGDVMGDAVDDDRVRRSFVQVYGPGLDKFGADAIEMHRIDALDERAGKSILHSKQNANFLHSCSLVSRGIETTVVSSPP
jgi:hypothetical protein